MEFVDQIVIQVALSEQELALTANEQNDVRYSYKIWDGRTGNQMFFAEEDETCYNNAKLPSGRPYGKEREFVMPFVDSMGNEGFKLNKTRSTRADDFSMFCCCCCCCPVNRCCKCGNENCAHFDND